VLSSRVIFVDFLRKTFVLWRERAVYSTRRARSEWEQFSITTVRCLYRTRRPIYVTRIWKWGCK